jgi:SAM-dependent methyltransferase
MIEAVPEPEGEMLDRPPELARMFDRAAAGYEARPGYPDWVFALLRERCGLGPGTRVLEVGPGTGQATLPILDCGAEITAVEPGAALSERLVERTPGRAIEVVVSQFESVELPEATFDLIAAGTAFHWIDISVGVERCARYLRDDGWLALWWTIWGDPDRPDPFHEALRPILESKAPQLLNDDAGTRAYMRDVAARASEFERSAAFDAVQEDTLRWEGEHDPPALRAMFATFAGWIALPEPVRTDLLDDVEHVAQEDFGGVVRRPYRTVLYTTPRRPR